jgi:hypothetical protein
MRQLVSFGASDFLCTAEILLAKALDRILLHMQGSAKQERCHMQLTRWLSLCAIVGGAGVILIEPILGWEGFVALTGADSDLRVMGGAVVLVGILTMILGDLENEKLPSRKGPSS